MTDAEHGSLNDPHELHPVKNKDGDRGFLVNSGEMKLTFIPQKKAEHALALLDTHVCAALNEDRQLQSSAGTLLYLASAVELAPLYIRTLYGALTGVDASSSSVIELETGLVQDLQFWEALLSSPASGSPIASHVRLTSSRQCR